MGNLVDHARKELEAAGLFSEDSDYEGELGAGVLRLIEAFAAQGHSGFSAEMSVSIFEKLARFKPLGQLTGEDSEWNEVGHGLWQNNRCSHVFKESDGAYDSEGRVFREPSGVCYTSRDSRVPVTFPYTPTREYVDVPASEEEQPDG